MWATVAHAVQENVRSTHDARWNRAMGDSLFWRDYCVITLALARNEVQHSATEITLMRRALGICLKKNGKTGVNMRVVPVHGQMWLFRCGDKRLHPQGTRPGERVTSRRSYLAACWKSQWHAGWPVPPRRGPPDAGLGRHFGHAAPSRWPKWTSAPSPCRAAACADSKATSASWPVPRQAAGAGGTGQRRRRRGGQQSLLRPMPCSPLVLIRTSSTGC